jgi:hypothetical protein
MSQQITFTAVQFSNGLFAVNREQPDMKVTAVCRASHGDWKTQSVHDYFMGMEDGESGELLKVFKNFEGHWCRVKIDDRTADISPSDLSATPNS